MGNALSSSPLPVLTLPPAFAGCTAPTVFENTILTAAAAVPVLLTLVPAAVGVMTRSVVKVLRLLSEPSLWAGIMNSVIWVLYAFIAAKRVECMELVLAYPIILTVNFTSLLGVYGYYGHRWMAFFLSLIVLSCLSFVFYAIKFEFFLPLPWETGLGLVGLLILLVSHGCLIWDIKVVVGLREYAIAIMNIVPPGFLNLATCYIILKKHPEQQFIAYSGLIGFSGAVLEFMLLIVKAIYDKFSRGNNGPPALPPGPQNFERLAKAVEASAARVAAAEERVEAIAGQIEELLARLQPAERQQHNLENNGADLRGILVEHNAVRTAGGQLQSNTTQDLDSGLQEEDDLGDSNGTVNSKKDLPITELSAGQVPTTDLDKQMTQQFPSESYHGDGEAKKTEQGKNDSLQLGSCDGEVKNTELGKPEILPSESCIGDEVKKTELGKNDSSKSESGGESKILERSGSGYTPTPRGWLQKFVYPENLPQKWLQKYLAGESLQTWLRNYIFPGNSPQNC